MLDERQVIAFLDRKYEQHAQVAHWTIKSQHKILQVMIRVLRECTLLEPLKQGWRAYESPFLLRDWMSCGGQMHQAFHQSRTQRIDKGFLP